MILVVTNVDGSLKEKDKIRLHHSNDEAGRYGQEVYGFGRFKIQKFSVWNKTKQAKFARLQIATLQRMRKFKK